MKKIISFFMAIVFIVSIICTITIPTLAKEIPSDSYEKTGTYYIVDGKKYYQAKTIKEYNGVAADCIFYLDEKGSVVNNKPLLDKLTTIELFNDVREVRRSSAESYAEAAGLYYEVFVEIVNSEKMGSLIGKASGNLISVLTPGYAFEIGDVAIDILEESCSPETIKTTVLIGMLRVYSNNTYACGIEVANLMKDPVIDYDSVIYCANLYAQCTANFAAVDYLAGEQVRAMAESSTQKELMKYFKNVFVGFADSVIPDIPSVEITKYITDGVVSLADFAMNSGAAAAYQERFEKETKYLSYSYDSTKTIADKLSGASDVSNFETDNNTTPRAITQTEVEQKINQLVNLLDGKYFTTNQKSCGNNSCSSCNNKNIFKSSWFKQMFGTVSINQIPGHAYPNGGKGTPEGWTCHGFANFAMWYIFASDNNDCVGYNRIVDNVKLTKKNLEKYAKPGDVIRYGGHSVVLISINESNFTVLDCNAQLQGDGYARVRKHTYSYSGREGYTMAISRAKNYDTTSTAPIYSLSINYKANGGTIPGAQVIGEIYKVIVAEGLNVRASADANSARIGGIAKGTSVTVTEKKTAGGYTWGKISYNGKDGWIALENSWVSKTGSAWSQQYYINNGAIFKKSTSQIHTQSCEYGVQVENGLYNDTTFGLYRDGYVFRGWSLSATGGKIIDQNASFKPEELVPSLSIGNQSITVYAVWEQQAPPVTDYTVDKIYISSIPKKDIYQVGDTVDLSGISIIVEHTNGVCETVTDGFICTPSIISDEGAQDITVTYEGKTATFGIVATQTKERANNAVAKNDSVGYLLPSSSAATLKKQGLYKNDTFQVLCKDGNYYLCLMPWGASTTTKTNGVLVYVNVSDVQLNSSVPSAKEYYSMNPGGVNNAVVTENATVYYKPDGGANPITYANEVIAPKTVSKDQSVKVLFEMDGYYCIQTEIFTGFVAKTAIKLTPALYSISTSVSAVDTILGDAITSFDISVSGLLTNDTSVSVTDFSIKNPDLTTAGNKYAIITYKNLCALVNVCVKEPEIKEIKLESVPDKIFYALGDVFDPTGMTIKAIYDDDSIKDISNFVAYNYDFSEQGNTTVQIKYGNHTMYVPIVVYEKPQIEIFDAEGYSGQTVTVSVSYTGNDEMLMPTSFSLMLSYDSSRLRFIGLDNSGKVAFDDVTVVEVDEDTLLLTYESEKMISSGECPVVLIFEILPTSDGEPTYSEIVIDSVKLYDNRGNEFEVDSVNGNVFNVGKLSISFITNDSENAFATVIANYGEALQISVGTPERDGYTFDGWALTVDSQEVDYENGDSIECTDNLCLYAVWKTVNDNNTNASPDDEIEDEELNNADDNYSSKSETTAVEENTDVSEDTFAKTQSSGCGSSLLCGSGVLLLVLGAATSFIVKKKKR